MSLRRNALLLVLLAGVLAILGEWDNGWARLWYIPTALLLAGLAYESAARRQPSVRVRVTGPQRWRLGSAQSIELAFAQDAERKMEAEVALTGPDSFALEPRVAAVRMVRGQESTLRLLARPRRLGPHRWPAPRMRISGPLDLAWWSHTLSIDYSPAVIPDILTRPNRAPGDAAGGKGLAQRAGGGTEIMQLRPYRHLDPLRIVDWKASARRGRLISRELVEERHLEILIAVDAGRSSGLAAGEVDRLGLYVNVAARLAQRAAELDDAVGLLVFAERPLTMIAPARGGAAVQRIRRTLETCSVRPAHANPALAAARIRAAIPRRLLVVLLTDLLDASTEELLEAVELLRPKHFTFIGAVENPRIAALPSAAAADTLDPYRALAASEYHDTLAANVRALRALGAAALTARPDQLDRAVLGAYQRFRRQRRI
jgi:uncharacterized protein (DUF58 family)